MTTDTGAIFTKRDALRVFFRHKKKALGFFCLSLVLTCAVVLFFPRSYRSEAKLFVRVGRETVTLDPTAAVGQTVMVDRTQESDINSALDILNSRRIAEAVVNEIGYERILNPCSKTPNMLEAALDALQDRMRGLLDSQSVNHGTSTTDSKIEKAIRKLRKNTAASAPKKSSVITVAGRAESPDLAQEIVATMTNVFLKEHLRINRTSGSFDFFVEQEGMILAKLTETQATLRDKKNKFELATVAGKRQIVESRLRDIELEILNTERALHLSETKQHDLRNRVASFSPEIVTETISGFANEARDGMRQKLYELEIREEELKQTYKTSHPYVKAVQAQRQELAKVLNGQALERARKTVALNPTRQALELEMEFAEVNVATQSARRELLQRQRSAALNELKSLNAQEMEIVQLEREIEILEGKYRKHSELVEQARIDGALASEAISNVNIVQAASYVSKPVAPNKRLVLGLGLLAGFCGALGIAVTCDYIDPTLVAPEQAEARLALPVLLSIPFDRRASRKVRVRSNQP